MRPGVCLGSFPPSRLDHRPLQFYAHGLPCDLDPRSIIYDDPERLREGRELRPRQAGCPACCATCTVPLGAGLQLLAMCYIAHRTREPEPEPERLRPHRPSGGVAASLGERVSPLAVPLRKPLSTRLPPGKTITDIQLPVWISFVYGAPTFPQKLAPRSLPAGPLCDSIRGGAPRTTLPPRTGQKAWGCRARRPGDGPWVSCGRVGCSLRGCCRGDWRCVFRK
jgi:hypothetical protein